MLAAMFWRRGIEQRLAKIEELLIEERRQEKTRHEAAEKRLLQDYQQRSEEQARRAAHDMEQRFGMSAEEMSSEIEILDLDGQVKLRRRCRNLRVRDAISLSRILHWVGTARPQAKWLQYPGSCPTTARGAATRTL